MIKYAIDILMPGIFWACTTYLAHRFLYKFDRLVLIQVYTLISFLCASFLQLLQREPLTKSYNRYNPGFLEGVSGFYLLIFCIYGILFFAGDYKFAGLIEGRKYPPYVAGIALSTVAFFTIIVTAIGDQKKPKLSEVLACVIVIVFVVSLEIILKNKDSLDEKGSQFVDFIRKLFRE